MTTIATIIALVVVSTLPFALWALPQGRKLRPRPQWWAGCETVDELVSRLSEQHTPRRRAAWPLPLTSSLAAALVLWLVVVGL